MFTKQFWLTIAIACFAVGEAVAFTDATAGGGFAGRAALIFFGSIFGGAIGMVAGGAMVVWGVADISTREYAHCIGKFVSGGILASLSAIVISMGMIVL